MAREFDLISRYFHDIGPDRGTVRVDIGDDAAVIDVADTTDLAMTMDVLIAGVHFPQHTTPARIAHKALAVNLSDLAAMGATPAWFTLGLSLPDADEQWVGAFARSLAVVAGQYGIRLVGGDMTRGPLSVCINACGTLPSGGAVQRNGAKPGDRVLVSGSIGGAALGLDSYLGKIDLGEDEQQAVRDRLDRPEPRCALGCGLQGLATAAIDVSDGLGQDLTHLLTASGVGASIELARLPLHPAYRSRLPTLGYEPAIGFGDDYELLITAPTGALDGLFALAGQCEVTLTDIGVIESQPLLRLLDDSGTRWNGSTAGHDHFRDRS